jgi:hypothetical protein
MPVAVLTSEEWVAPMIETIGGKQTIGEEKHHG